MWTRRRTIGKGWPTDVVALLARAELQREATVPGAESALAGFSYEA